MLKMQPVKSRLEINIRRLMKRCEFMAKESEKDWRLEKFVDALQEMIEELKNSPDKPENDVILSYERKVEFLQGVLNAAKLPDPVERVIAAQKLPANIETPNESKDGPSITTQIHQKTTAKYNREIREELFETKSDGLRSRNTTASTNGNLNDSQDVDALIQFNREQQEKIAENMLSMTRNIKEHALTANALIKKDLHVLDKADQLTELNVRKLKGESLKLEEHNKSSWRCWLWLMLAFVLVVFFNMVLFMKVFPKKY